MMVVQIAIGIPRVASTAKHHCPAALSSRSPVRMQRLTDVFQQYTSVRMRPLTDAFRDTEHISFLNLPVVWGMHAFEKNRILFP
jgi:hypothetical protein